MRGTHHHNDHGRYDDHHGSEHDIYYRLLDNDIYVSCHVDFHPDHIITGDDRAADLLRLRAAIDAELGPAANVRVEPEQRPSDCTCLERLRDALESKSANGAGGRSLTVDGLAAILAALDGS